MNEKKSHKVRNTLLGVGAVIVVVAAAQSAGGSSSTPSTASASVAPWTTAQVKPEDAAQAAAAVAAEESVLGTTVDAPAPELDSFKDGTYLIGSEIPNGNYKCSDFDHALGGWLIQNSDGSLLAGQTNSLAQLNQGYSVNLFGCNNVWTKVS